MNDEDSDFETLCETYIFLEKVSPFLEEVNETSNSSMNLMNRLMIG